VQFVSNIQFSVNELPKENSSYSRTIVARVATGFERMVARWTKGFVGKVHGHPDYAFYHLLHGRLGVEHFSLNPSGPKLTTTTVMEPENHFCVEGIAGRYDNSIHRITALEESLSVHMYSDDALSGCCYHDYQKVSPFLKKSGENLFPENCK